MRPVDYPALFRAADEASDRHQQLYLRLIGGEYVLLFIAAVLSMELFSGSLFYLCFALVFVLLLALLLSRALLKPEQDWYGCRSLAESVKTLTWRYVMGAEPFFTELAAHAAHDEFRQHLQRTLDENRRTTEKIVAEWSDADQITNEMDRIRNLSLHDRRRVYRKDRVQEQRAWYSRKAAENKKSAKHWIAFGIGLYAAAMVLALSRIVFPDWHPWPIEPAIVLASSVIGWTQLKKFNELGAAYTVAAHEIGLITPRIEDAHTERQFSECVNEAELAFSREHTMWIARKTN